MRNSLFLKIVKLFPRRERWKLLLLLVAMLATGVIQAAGVASVMPFVALVANSDGALQNRWMAWAYDAGGFSDTRGFLFSVGVLVFVVFALGNALMAGTTWLGYRFVWYNNHWISQRLFRTYLSRPYEFFIGRHGTRLSKTLLNEVKEVITKVVVPCLEVLARTVTAVFIIGLLVVLDPTLAAFVLLTIGGTYALLYAVIRRRQGKLGERRVAAKTEQFRVAGEALGGIKEVKVLGREASFVARFRKPSLEYSRVSAANSTASHLPRYALETIAFGSVVVVLLYLLQTQAELSDVLPTIGVYAVAGGRLMPAFHEIFAGLTMIRFHAAALDELHGDLRGDDSDVEPARDSAPVVATDRAARTGSEIRFNNVSFRYPRSKRVVLNDVNIVIPRNATVGLVGASGCGKTTLVDLILGLFEPTAGNILIDGEVLDRSTVSAWRSRLGYVQQSIFLCDDTITRNVAFGIPDRDIDLAAVERAARAANLHAFVTQLPEGYDTVVGERGVRLSGGERQRIGIARAIYHDPDVLVMDEATSALDTVTEDAVMEAARDLAHSRTIILIAHRLSTVSHCDVIFLMQVGRVITQGTYGELAISSEVFRAMAGLDS